MSKSHGGGVSAEDADGNVEFAKSDDPSLAMPKTAYEIVEPADAIAIFVALLFGVIYEITMQQSNVGIATTILMLSAPALLLFTHRVKHRFARWMVTSGALFAVFLSLRDDASLHTLNVLAIVGALVFGAMASREPSPFRSSTIETAWKTLYVLPLAFQAITFMLKPVARLRERQGKGKSVAVGILIALPMLYVLGALLASADAVFASFFSFDTSTFSHIIGVLFGSWLLGIALCLASIKFNDAPEPSRRFGSIELITALSLIALLYTIFVISQIVVWVGGAKHVLQTAGLTYAEHAREGFFQLILVGAFTIVVVLGLSALRQNGSPKLNLIWKAVTLSTIALTLIIVLVAISRLSLYEHAYGLTIDRFYATTIAIWLGVVFVVLAVNLARNEEGRSWFFSATGMITLVFLLGLNLVQPEKMVVDRNLDRGDRSSIPLDTYYLAGLDGDGINAVFDRFADLNIDQQNKFLNNVCINPLHTSNSDTPLSYNLSRRNAQKRLDRKCASLRRD